MHQTEGEGMMDMHPNYTAVGSVDGKLVIISNIDRLKAIGGGMDTRQIGPIVAGLRTLLVKPHTGWDVKDMAKWFTRGPLSIVDAAAHQ